MRRFDQNGSVAERRIGGGRDAVRHAEGTGTCLALEDAVVLDVGHTAERADVLHSRSQEPVVGCRLRRSGEHQRRDDGDHHCWDQQATRPEERMHGTPRMPLSRNRDMTLRLDSVANNGLPIIHPHIGHLLECGVDLAGISFGSGAIGANMARLLARRPLQR